MTTTRAMRWRPIVGLALAVAAPAVASGPTMPTTRRATTRPQLAPPFVARERRGADGRLRRYALFLPARYDAAERWPLIVALHGSGERGTDGVQPTQVGLGPFIAKHRETFPFVAVFPQAMGWFRGTEARAVFEIIEATRHELSIDDDRIYLTGLSMGGFGTWELAMQRPDLFAAIVPICGGGPIEGVRNLVRTPVWAFHGALDDRVPVEESRRLIAALRDLGTRPRYTEFREVRHNSWDRAYATRGLFSWLREQRRPEPPPAFDLWLDPAATPVPTQLWWLRIDAVVARAKHLRIRAALMPPREVWIATDGITDCTLLLGRMAAEAGGPVRVIWQKDEVYEGPLKAEIPLKVPPGKEAPEPPEAPLNSQNDQPPPATQPNGGDK